MTYPTERHTLAACRLGLTGKLEQAGITKV